MLPVLCYPDAGWAENWAKQIHMPRQFLPCESSLPWCKTWNNFATWRQSSGYNSQKYATYGTVSDCFTLRLTIDLLIQLQISVNLDDCRTPVGLGRQASRIRSRGLLTRLGAVARPKARPPPRLATREEAPNWTRPHLRRGRTRRLLPRPQHPGRPPGPRRLSARPNRRLVCSISSDTL